MGLQSQTRLRTEPLKQQTEPGRRREGPGGATVAQEEAGGGGGSPLPEERLQAPAVCEGACIPPTGLQLELMNPGGRGWE